LPGRRAGIRFEIHHGEGGPGTMGRIDEAAAREEVQKAVECNAHADQLTIIANELRKEARYHLKEAEELRGAPKTRH
jgi:hypothetical protein